MCVSQKVWTLIVGRNWIKGGPKWHRIDECKGRPSAFHFATMVSSSAHWWRQLSTFCRCTVNEKQINRPIMARLIKIMKRLTPCLSPLDFEISSVTQFFFNFAISSLKNRKINLISKLIFAGYTGSKNQVWTRQKIKLVWKSIFSSL